MKKRIIARFLAVIAIAVRLNLAIVNVSIPEFGMLGTLMAGGAGLGLMVYMRRRDQPQL
jgi:hypothetical protein